MLAGQRVYNLSGVSTPSLLDGGAIGVKRLEVELPDQLAGELEAAVKAGWFASESEVVRMALHEFVRRHRFELIERFQRDDIAWALRQRPASA
jgi:Arc/MetJ-type ribon-helix-helix transcriptional regulator